MSTDNYISRSSGTLYHTEEKSDPSDTFLGGCVIIENYSGYVIINHQVAINGTETVKA